MLLQILWSRSSALALMATLATCSPVPSPRNSAVDTAPSLESAPGNEQVTNLTKRDISVRPGAVDFIHPSILTRDLSGSTGSAPHAPPAIVLLSQGKTYRPGNIVDFKWDPHTTLKQVDLCVAYYGAVTSIPVCTDFGNPLSTGRSGFVIPSADAIPWKDVTGHDGVDAEISAFLYFSFSPSHYRDDFGKPGIASGSFKIQKNKK